MSGTSYFSKLDTSKGYWEIKVDKQNSNLLVFGTRSGRYQGKSFKEHDKCLRKVFLKIRECGLKLNKTKCQIRKESFVFLGHIILSGGIKMDPSKTEAITKMPLPRSVK